MLLMSFDMLQAPAAEALDSCSLQGLNKRLDTLQETAKDKLVEQVSKAIIMFHGVCTAATKTATVWTPMSHCQCVCSCHCCHTGTHQSCLLNLMDSIDAGSAYSCSCIATKTSACRHACDGQGVCQTSWYA